MSKQVDPTKIEAIKRATVKVVVEHGMGGASIALIAKESRVSSGYLYRFYKGKRELIAQLFIERFEEIQQSLNDLLETHTSVLEIVDKFTRRLYDTAQENSDIISFYDKLLSDFSFEIPEECKVNITKICEEIVKMGKNTGEINSDFTPECFYVVVVGGILHFMNIRLRAVFQDNKFTEKEIENSIRRTMNAMK